MGSISPSDACDIVSAVHSAKLLISASLGTSLSGRKLAPRGDADVNLRFDISIARNPPVPSRPSPAIGEPQQKSQMGRIPSVEAEPMPQVLPAT